MNRDAFIERYYSSTPESAKRPLNMFLDKIDGLMSETGCSLENILSNHELLVKLYSTSGKLAGSKAYFQRTNGYIKDLADFCGITLGALPTEEDVLLGQEIRSYFRDMDDLLATIDKVGQYYLDVYDPMTDLIIVKSAALFGWYGLSVKETASLRDDCLSVENGKHLLSYTGKNSEEKKIEIDETGARIVDRLSRLSQYRGLPSGRMINLSKDGKYLFPVGSSAKGESSSAKEYRDHYITFALRRFNSLDYLTTRKIKISYSVLPWNALFVNLYESGGAVTAKRIQETTGCEKTISYSKKRQYDAWLKMFHPEDKS